jgi:hypothetical protein
MKHALPFESTFLIGDTVRVTRPGRNYSTHARAAAFMNLKNWQHLRSIIQRNGEYTVIDTATDQYGNKLVGISNGTEDYVIGENGVEKITTKIQHSINKPAELQQFDENNLYTFDD